MVGRFDIARCGPCCDFTCLVSDGDLVGNACTGTWNRDVGGGYGTPNHETDDDDAIWFDETLGPSLGSAGWKVSATFNFVITDSDPDEFVEVFAGHWEVMVIGAFADCSNYVFMRRIAEKPLSGNSYFQHQLGIVIAGVETILAEHVESAAVAGCIEATDEGELHADDGFTLADGGAVQGGLPALVTLILCWDGETLWGNVKNVNAGIAAHAVPGVGELSSLLTGRKSGFGTGTLSAEVTDCIVTGFDYRRSNSDDSEGTPCGDCSEHCCGSPVPEEAMVEITTNGCTEPTNECTDFPWDIANGTWTLSRVNETIISTPGSAGDPANGCSGDAWCVWRADFTSGTLGAGCDPSYQVATFSIIVRVTKEAGGYRITAAVEVTNLGAAVIGIDALKTNLANPCDEMTDWITLDAQLGETECIGDIGWRVKLVPA